MLRNSNKMTQVAQMVLVWEEIQYRLLEQDRTVVSLPGLMSTRHLRISA